MQMIVVKIYVFGILGLKEDFLDPATGNLVEANEKLTPA